MTENYNFSCAPLLQLNRYTCTGTLLGVPKDSKDKACVAVDKWVNAKHYLSKKSGQWQIVGVARHWLVEPKVKYGEDVKYQLEFHPLF